MSAAQHLPHLALLEVLTPPTGWRTDRALLSSYSADPAVLAAALMALAGRDPEDGTPTRIALARALVELRGRVTFVVQRGRLAVPTAGGQIAGLLDRFIREARYDERERSWHAKLALVRFVPDRSAGALWRLWLGSRNLTRDTSWDMCLQIDGEPSRATQASADIAEISRRLAAEAGEAVAWQPLVAELGGVAWRMPRGLQLQSVALMLPRDRGRSLPRPPDGLQKVLAVSPFLDGSRVTALGRWGDERCERSLLSSRPALAEVAAQRGQPFSRWTHLLTLPPPGEVSVSEPGSAEAVLEDRGLHAKLIWTTHASGHTLWLGSPNLTVRGWTQNAEVVAEVLAERRGGAAAVRALEDGIARFKDSAQPITPVALGAASAADPDRKLLEDAQKEVAARFVATQRREQDGTVLLRCDGPPHPGHPEVKLEIARLNGGKWAEWARGIAHLPLAAERDAWSDLVNLRVSFRDEALSWTQAAPFDPPRANERDGEILAEWLGPLGRLAAVRELLTGLSATPEDRPWDVVLTATRAVSGKQTTSVMGEVPSLEQVLRAWQRDPGRLALVDALLAAPDGDPGQEGATALAAFRRTWAVLKAGLEIEAGFGSHP